jgi:hypothetical protein
MERSSRSIKPIKPPSSRPAVYLGADHCCPTRNQTRSAMKCAPPDWVNGRGRHDRRGFTSKASLDSARRNAGLPPRRGAVGFDQPAGGRFDRRVHWGCRIQLQTRVAAVDIDSSLCQANGLGELGGGFAPGQGPGLTFVEVHLSRPHRRPRRACQASVEDVEIDRLGDVVIGPELPPLEFICPIRQSREVEERHAVAVRETINRSSGSKQDNDAVAVSTEAIYGSLARIYGRRPCKAREDVTRPSVIQFIKPTNTRCDCFAPKCSLTAQVDIDFNEKSSNSSSVRIMISYAETSPEHMVRLLAPLARKAT